jgi:hypothetical protein
MFRFTVGSLSGGGGGGVSAVSIDRQTDVAKLIDDFCGLQIFAVNTPELFRCVYISICVYFDLRTFRCAYFCQLLYPPYRVCAAVLLVANRPVLSSKYIFVTVIQIVYINYTKLHTTHYKLHNTTHSPL